MPRVLLPTETSGTFQTRASGWFIAEIQDWQAQVSVELKYLETEGKPVEFVELFTFNDSGAKTFLMMSGRLLRISTTTPGAIGWINPI